jgi:hypothetical protein
MSEVQTPWLSEEDAEVIIDRYRVTVADKESSPTDPPASLFDDVVFREVARSHAIVRQSDSKRSGALQMPVQG